MPLPTFTDEHEMLRRTVRAFVEKEVVPHVDGWEEDGRIPRAFWRRLGELGLLGLEFPAEYGGGGGDFLSSVVLGEEMARCRSGGVAFSVLVHTDMSSPWLTRFGTEAQKRRYLPGMRAWINGRRREQAATRQTIPVVERYQGDLYKINPLASWNSRDTFYYMERHGIPLHPLFDQGYASIGCAPCTRPVLPGEAERAGRWAGQEKTECGLHTFLEPLPKS